MRIVGVIIRHARSSTLHWTSRPSHTMQWLNLIARLHKQLTLRFKKTRRHINGKIHKLSINCGKIRNTSDLILNMFWQRPATLNGKKHSAPTAKMVYRHETEGKGSVDTGESKQARNTSRACIAKTVAAGEGGGSGRIAASSFLMRSPASMPVQCVKDCCKGELMCGMARNWPV
jgi:hypothetical protein